MIAILMLCLLRDHVKPVSILALKPIEPIKEGLRGTLCTPFFYKIVIGLLCNYFANMSKSRLNLKISSKGPYLNLS